LMHLLGALDQKRREMRATLRAVYQECEAATIESWAPSAARGAPTIRREGDALTLVALSAIVPKALKVAERLAQEGYNIEVIDPRSLNPFDRPTIIESVNRTYDERGQSHSLA
jgi:pyruvate/2-oxoglutarate/acetoin dehydrogenase E1 component